MSRESGYQNSFLCLFLIILMGCTSQEEPSMETESESFLTINLGQVANEPEDFPLSNIVSEVEIVPLETRPDILIGDDPWAIDAGDFFIINCDEGLFRFDKTGKFLNTISPVGRGPGEHIPPPILDGRYYNSDSIVVALWLTSKPQLFKPDGTFMGVLNSPFSQTPIGRLSDSVWFNTGSWAGVGKQAKDSTVLTFFSNNGQVIKTISREVYPTGDDYSPRDGSVSPIGINFPEPFIDYDERTVVFYMPGNDTVFDISEMSLKPIGVINPGEYRIPYNANINMNEMIGKAQFDIQRMTENNIFLRKMDALITKRLDGVEFVSFTRAPFQQVIYNKNSGNAKTVRIVDDIFGLLTTQFNVTTLFMNFEKYGSHVNWKGKNPVIITSAFELIQLLKNVDKSKLSTEAQLEFQKLEPLVESSNPVMFVLKLKENIILNDSE